MKPIDVQVLKCLSGELISNIWVGGGSSLFVELGELKKVNNGEQEKGKYTISLEYNWRLEKENKIILGSASEKEKLLTLNKTLIGLKVFSLQIYTHLDDLLINIENNYQLRSFTDLDSDPEWSVQMADGEYVYSEHGQIKKDRDDASRSANHK